MIDRRPRHAWQMHYRRSRQSLRRGPRQGARWRTPSTQARGRRGEQRQRLAGTAQPRDLARSASSAASGRPSLGCVEVVGERGRGATEGIERSVRVAARGEEQLCSTDGAVELRVVELHGTAREEAEHRPLLGRRGTLERTNPVADGFPRHVAVLSEPGDQRVPALPRCRRTRTRRRSGRRRRRGRTRVDRSRRNGVRARAADPGSTATSSRTAARRREHGRVCPQR